MNIWCRKQQMNEDTDKLGAYSVPGSYYVDSIYSSSQGLLYPHLQMGKLRHNYKQRLSQVCMHLGSELQCLSAWPVGGGVGVRFGEALPLALEKGSWSRLGAGSKQDEFSPSARATQKVPPVCGSAH